MPTFLGEKDDKMVEESYMKGIVSDKPSDTKYKVNRSLRKTVGKPMTILGICIRLGIFMELVLFIALLVYMFFGNSKDPDAIKIITMLLGFILFMNFKYTYGNLDVLDYDKHPEILNRDAILAGRVPCTVSSKFSKIKEGDLILRYYISNGKEIFEVSEYVYQSIGTMGILFYEGDPIDYDIDAWSLYVKP